MIHATKCLTWNTEWAPPNKLRGRLLANIISNAVPDVVCYTEVKRDFIPDGHCIEADPDYGYKHNGSRRKVALWSKEPWEEADIIGDAGMPGGRFISGISCGVRFVGVCIPWKDAHVNSGRKDRRPWEDHIRYCEGLGRVLERYSEASEPICMLGDFNQRVPRSYQPSEAFDALSNAIPETY